MQKRCGNQQRRVWCDDMEAERMRIRAESTERWVKLKTVTEIRRSSARVTFTAKS